MPYSKISDLPDSVEDLPKHAKEIYMAAFNSAFKQYEGDEAKSHGTAWAAVKTKYKKNDQGEWVAKEAKMPDKDKLQSVYSEIIQELGRRNAAADSSRIKKIMELCRELLSSEGEDEKTKEALKEADSVLTWLKEQKVMKTEDGVEFPAEAYAYVPDSGKPSEWKLRLWEDPEKKVTRVQLGKAAAALSPGGFRGQKVEIPREDLSAVKRKIRAEYRKLDVEDEDIPRWVKEAESRELLADYIPLTEAKVGSKGKALVTIIKAGFNSAKDRYYPHDTLSRDYKVFEGIKMYADHPTDKEEKERPERSIRDWVATLQNVRPENDRIVGEAVVVEPWMQERLATLRDNEMLKDMGISINAVGTASKAEIEGVKTNFIERIVRARSVDFVTEAGAGGGVQLYEAVTPELDIDLVGLDTLKERRPDLVKNIETNIRAEITKEVKRKMELEDKVKELEGQVETLTTERDELKGKLEEADKEKAKAEAQAVIKEAVDKAELPDAAKERILERFKDAESADGVEEAVKSETDYIAKLADAGKVKNLGESKPNPEKDREALKESFKNMHPEWTESQIEIAVSGR